MVNILNKEQEVQNLNPGEAKGKTATEAHAVQEAFV